MTIDPRIPNTRPSHNQRLDRLAEIAIKVGLQLRSGQELVMTAPIDALPLARRITEHAVQAGRVAGDDVVLG